MASQGDYVVLLHGIARSKLSMKWLERQFEREGFVVVNATYPSTKMPIEDIAQGHLKPLIEKRCPDASKKIHFITHSMGGLVLRVFLTNNKLANLGRVVMLAPPNKGSAVVDFMKKTPVLRQVFEFIYGPAGDQMAAHAKSYVNKLGPVDYDVGVIAGEGSFNPLGLILSEPSDGTVPIESTKLDGMKDHIVIDANHTFIMYEKEATVQALYFLEHGHFNKNSD